MFSSVAIAKTLGTFLISTFANRSIATKKQWFAIVKFAKSLGTKFLKIEHQTEKILRNKYLYKFVLISIITFCRQLCDLYGNL